MAQKPNYWLEQRSAKRLVASEKIGNKAISQVIDIYEEALRNINRELNRIFVNYANSSGLAVDELSQIISGSDRAKFLVSIQEKMAQLGFKIDSVYDIRYLSRISRLEALKAQIYWNIITISPQETDITGRAYRKIVESTYKTSTRDIQVGGGVTPSFATLNTTYIDEILSTKWLRSNFKTRIKKNVSEFANELPTIIGATLTSGKNYELAVKTIRDRFGVAKSDATRLVRTETNFFNNKAELTSYEDQGIEFYQFSAILDNHTSKVCEEANGKQYPISEAIAGVNYPPLHPNCRSSTIPIFPEEYGTRFISRSGRMERK